MHLKRPALALCLILFFCSLLCIRIGPRAATGEGVHAFGGPDAAVKDFQFAELEAWLKTTPPGVDRDYFSGVLANREGRTEESIHLLANVLPSIRVSQPRRAAVALEALADDYDKSFRYKEAALTDDDLLKNFALYVDPKKLQGTKDDAVVMHLLSEASPQSIVWRGPVRLKTERNPINSTDTELTVNGVREQWLLDSGANFSVVTTSFARRLELNPLPGFAQTTSGITGVENPLRVAVLPKLGMGGAELHNVVMLILEDANLKVSLGKESYQINGIIGYPVFQALSVVTFVHDGWFEAGEQAQRSGTGARMYMKSLTPVTVCGVEGHDLPFTLDTGASGTSLSVRYFDRFRAEIRNWKRSTNKSFGAGGIVSYKIYLQPSLNLNVGDKTVTLENVPIFPRHIGSSLDELYGNLGQDVVAKFDSFTLDFSAMTFSLGLPLPDRSAH